MIPVDFEADADWWRALLDAGFDDTAPAVVSSSGVSMYLTEDANVATLRELARLAPGSVVAMSFMLPFDLVDEAERPGLEGAARGARASGTPWLSFYAPDEIVAVARDAGFPDVEVVTTEDIAALPRGSHRRPAGVRRRSGVARPHLTAPPRRLPGQPAVSSGWKSPTTLPSVSVK